MNVLYIDEEAVEIMGADATIGAECPFHFPDLRVAWWIGQKERLKALTLDGNPQPAEQQCRTAH